MTVRLHSSVMMPMLGIGTFKVRGYDIVFQTLREALKCGYRAIDTAAVYRNEEDIGKALHILLQEQGLQRTDVFITSKLAPKDQGASKCRDAVMTSLRHLDTAYLDLYLIHWPGVQKVQPGDSRNAQLRRESWREMEQLVREGKIRSIGVSNYTKRHMTDLLDTCDINPAVLQIEHHPHLIQTELVDLCKQEGIHFQAYSSLGTTSDNNQLLTDPVVQAIAEKRQKSAAQILLKWAVQQNIGVIPKSTNPEHIHENINIFDFELEECDMKQLNGLGCDKHYCWNPEKIV